MVKIYKLNNCNIFFFQEAHDGNYLLNLENALKKIQQSVDSNMNNDIKLVCFIKNKLIFLLKLNFQGLYKISH